MVDTRDTPAGEFGTTDDPFLLALVGNLQVMTYVYLGKVVDPSRGETARNLDAAKVSIDTLQMLRRKTTGNLTESEAQFLDHVIFELQMNYVDESSKPEPTPPASDAAATPEEDQTQGE